MFFFIAMLSFIACNKKGSNNLPQGNTPTLKGKWNVDSRVIKDYAADTLSSSNAEPADGSTWDFQNDGHVIIVQSGSSPETHSYSIQGNKVTIDGFVFDIQDLTAVTVTLYIKHDFAT